MWTNCKVEHGLRLSLNCGHTASLGCTLLGTLADEKVNPSFAENICVVEILRFLLLGSEVIVFSSSHFTDWLNAIQNVLIKIARHS